jgi:hypothetical protein
MNVLAPVLMAVGLIVSMNTVADDRIPWSQLAEPAGSYDALVEWQGRLKPQTNSHYRSSVQPGTSDGERQLRGTKPSSGAVHLAVREPSGTSDAAREAIRIAQRLQRLVNKGSRSINISAR